MSPSNNSFSFWQYIITTSVGAVIGLGASLVVTTVQSHAQMRLAVFEHRVKALSDLEQVVHGDVTHWLLEALDLENRAKESDFSNPRDRQNFNDKKLRSDQEFIALIGKANVNISIVNAVFGSKIGIVDLSATELVGQTMRRDKLPGGGARDDRDANIAELADARKVVFEKLTKGLQQEIDKLPSPSP